LPAIAPLPGRDDHRRCTVDPFGGDGVGPGPECGGDQEQQNDDDHGDGDLVMPVRSFSRYEGPLMVITSQ
jgi:hypothetical protein